MRDYILTDIERTIIKEYMATGKKLENFKVLAYRLRNQNTAQISEDLELIKQFLAKIGEKPA